MSAGKIFLVSAIVLVGGFCLTGGCLYSGYARSIALDEAVKSNWAQVENQLQRRFELVPNLVETVKGVAGQEQDIFLGIANARAAYFQAKDQPSIGDRAKAAGAYESALSRLLVLQETYPALRSNESFLKLQDTLEGTENRISVERQRYNESVKALNTFVRGLTGKLYANLAGVQPAEYFDISEAAKATPKVDFGKKPPPTGGGP